ncbi:MAG TPA: hypothetical protein VF599_00880 [Pyrinomonadaceae bacterium]
MERRENDKLALFEALQAKGWHLEDNCLYSPNGGIIRLEGNSEVPRHMIEKMYERTKDVFEKMLESQPPTTDKALYENHIQDLETIIITLKEFLAEQAEQKDT